MRSSVGFGGYPEFQERRARYNDEEPPPPPEEEAAAAASAGAAGARERLLEEVRQARLLHHVVVHLQRGEGRPEAPPPRAPAAASVSSAGVAAPALEHLSAEELRAVVQAVGWNALKRPFTFDAPPDLVSPYASRDDLVRDTGPDFQTATVLNDALAAQFGPSMLGEDRSFRGAVGEGCFTQVNATPALEPTGAPARCWQAIPQWMRCSMVVISTGPGGNGVAFHKHGTAWLVLREGRKRWWLYPPRGPPTQEAYSAVALCPAWRLPEIVAALPVEERPLHLVQGAGAGLFVPALWWHATLDEGPTLGLGSQHNMADIGIFECYREQPESAFALYHMACEIHKTEEERAMQLFEEAIRREPLNFYFRTNQLLFYLNMVLHPQLAVSLIERLFEQAKASLDDRRQMIVLRFVVPTICNFAEWHAPHDRLIRYGHRAIACAREALMELAGPVLPGGARFRLGRELPFLADLRYEATCSQCGCRAQGKAGQPGSIRAHRFLCDACWATRESATCAACGSSGGEGQMGHPGTDFAKNWYCAKCWMAWKKGPQVGAPGDPGPRGLVRVPPSDVEWQLVD